MIVRKYQFIALTFLGFCVSLLPSSGSPGGWERAASLRPGSGRSIPGIAFYHDFPPGTYAFTVQSYGLPTGAKDVVQLAPGTETYLEILWGASWLVGTAGGATYYVRTLPPDLGPAYLQMLKDKGPPRAV